MVDLHFPLALYKKLLNVKPGLEDLKELSPTEGRYEAERWGTALAVPVPQGFGVENTALSDHMARLLQCRWAATHLRHCL